MQERKQTYGARPNLPGADRLASLARMDEHSAATSEADEANGEPSQPNGQVATHDNLSFEQLAESYNLLNISTYGRVFTNLILHECGQRSAPRVLDVGCGRGIGRHVSLQREIKAACGEFWGLEPDQGVTPEEGLFDNFQHALMETAELPADSFDIAYSSMVMEHVERPEEFLAAVRRSLKPGGVYLFLTPNAKSLVPRLTKLCRDLRIDEWSLRLVRGRQQIEEYHYPVQFRCNTPQQITRLAEQLGFADPEFAFIEGSGSRNYFPGPLRPLYQMLLMKRRLLKNPRSLVTMICRLTRQ